MRVPDVDGLVTLPLRGASIVCLERGGFKQTPEERTLRGDGEVRHRQRLRCGHCGHFITDAEQRIVVDGAHTHRHSNPAGQLFEIGCFRSAPGCIQRGESTAEHTWFAGYCWDVAWCESCRVHLGWRYTGESREPFHGLILDRLSREQ